MKGECELKLFFRHWGRAAIGRVQARLYLVFSRLGLPWDPQAETYCWPNITRRSLLATAASGACHPLETLQTLITRCRWKSRHFLTFFFFLFKADVSLQLQGHQQLEFGGLQQEHRSLKVFVSTSSSHECNAKNVSCVSHPHIISYYYLNYSQASKAEFYQ